MFTASKSALSAALSLSSEVIERRNTIPILSNIMIEAANGGLLVRMTDLDIEASVFMPAVADTSFQPFTVPALLLREIVGKLADGSDVRVDAGKDAAAGVTVKSGRSKFSLQVLPAADFPALGAPVDPHRFTVNSKAFVAAISGVGFAISTEETRYYLNGIYMHAVEAGIMLVATDGHRLAKRFVPIENMPAGMPGVIIPRKTIRTLGKILPKDGAEVAFEVTDAKIAIEVAGTRLVSKLVDGTFPDYIRVIPVNNTAVAEIDGKALKAAVDRVSAVSSERGRAVRFSFSDGSLTLSVNNPDAGSAEDQLSYDGTVSMETGFNAKYVLEALQHLPDGTLTMALEQTSSPAILRVDGDHADNLIVLMPMRVN